MAQGLVGLTELQKVALKVVCWGHHLDDHLVELLALQRVVKMGLLRALVMVEW